MSQLREKCDSLTEMSNPIVFVFILCANRAGRPEKCTSYRTCGSRLVNKHAHCMQKQSTQTGAAGANETERAEHTFMRAAEAATPLIDLYRRAVLAILRTDTSRAWTRKEILLTATNRGLVPTPINIPVLRVALQDLMKRGNVVRIITGYYRLAEAATECRERSKSATGI